MVSGRRSGRTGLDDQGRRPAGHQGRPDRLLPPSGGRAGRLRLLPRGREAPRHGAQHPQSVRARRSDLAGSTHASWYRARARDLSPEKRRRAGIGNVRMTNAPVFDQTFASTFEQLLVWRRDVRRFKTDPLDAATVRHLIELACLAPSVGNAQPWRFVMVETPARRAVVRTSFERCNHDALSDF